MSGKTNKDCFVTLHSRGGEVIYVPHLRHRLFLKEADKLIMELEKKIEEKTRKP